MTTTYTDIQNIARNYYNSDDADTFYVTVWGGEASLQHTIAGWMMRKIEDNPIFPAALLNAVIPASFSPNETVEITPLASLVHQGRELVKDGHDPRELRLTDCMVFGEFLWKAASGLVHHRSSLHFLGQLEGNPGGFFYTFGDGMGQLRDSLKSGEGQPLHVCQTQFDGCTVCAQLVE